MKPTNMTCKNCEFWNNKQAELSYNQFYGICTCWAWKFAIDNYKGVRVLDRMNLTKTEVKAQEFESQSNEVPYKEVTPSRYCLVTAEEFFCVNYKTRSKR